MALLLDTHVLLWVGTDSPRLSGNARDALVARDVQLFISSVIAYEFEDLRVRGRFGASATLEEILTRLSAVVLDFPADADQLVALLPNIHRDPVDRMLVAHALHADMTIVTADRTMREYPVRTIW